MEYRAIVDPESLKIHVFAEREPRDFLGTRIDRELTSWEPPDLDALLRDVRSKIGGR